MKSNKLKITELSVSQISPFEGNPRKISDTGLRILEKSVKHYGITNPILVWCNPRKPDKYEILAGHQRFKIFQKLNFKQIPAIILDIQDYHDAYGYLIMDNKSQDYSSFDFPRLADLLLDLDDGSIEDVEITGFEETEIQELATWTPTDRPARDDRQGGPQPLECPQCGYEWTPEK